MLKNINVTFPDKQLSVICGPTGAGKSLFLASIIGEADLVSGRISVPYRRWTSSGVLEEAGSGGNWMIESSIAFVSQSPWIENGTVKDNILFGLPFSTQRYVNVIDACALNDDLGTLVDGDMTEIGPRGVNLSGGQRWRLSLARALYSRAGILIMVR
jgi:ABC-type multidrug transport system fused ATPase/permease subunit